MAEFVCETLITHDQVIGLGTGVAINYILDEISQRMNRGKLSGIYCVAASDVSASEAAFRGIPQLTLNDVDSLERRVIDIMFDEADELDFNDGQVAYVVGRGENGDVAPPLSIPRLREVVRRSEFRVAIASGQKSYTSRITGKVPVIIENSEDWEDIAEELDDIFLGDAELCRRSGDPLANPRGGDCPVRTPEGHLIVDINFYDSLKLFGEEVPYEVLVKEIELVPGVITHGIMVDTANTTVVENDEWRIFLGAK